MKILNLIRDRLAERRVDDRSKYWALLQRIAPGTLSDRAAKAAAEEIESLLPSLNKSLNDVQNDIDTMSEFNSTTALATKRRLDAAALQQVVAAGLEVEAQAKQLEARAKAQRAKHAEEVGKARAALRATDGAAARLVELRRRLAVAGFPEFAGLIEQQQRQREVDRVANDLAAAERDLVACEQAADSWPKALLDGPADSAQAAAARHARRDVETSRAHRDQLAKQLAELRGGAQVDDGEDVTDQLLAEEVRP